MKKILFSLCLALASTTASAEFTSLKITPISGDATVVSVDALEIAVADGNLVITNADGEYSLPVADLSTMEFSNDEPSAAIELTSAANVGQGVTVYAIDGRCFGDFSSTLDAKTILPAGIYVAKSTDGSTSKIAVK